MRRTKHSRIAAAIAGTLLLILAAGARPVLAGQSMESLDEILKQVAVYDGGIHSEALWKLRDAVWAARSLESSRAACETRLLDFLAVGKATPSAKAAVAKHLRMIGSEKAVPFLEPLLLDPAMADAALYALARIPGPAVDQALLQALPRAPRTVKPALISVLGDRGAASAVAPLAKLASDHTGEFVGPAATALGAIGSGEAANALLSIQAGVRPDVKAAVSSAMLRCAEVRRGASDDRAAAALYDKILADAGLPSPIREAAMIGKLHVSGDRATALLLEQLKGDDPIMQAAAVASLKDIIKPETVETVCALLPGRPETVQSQILSALASYPKPRVLPAVLKAARGDSAPVRLAAYKTLETVGDALVAGFLVETSARTKGGEQAAVRAALDALNGRQADEAVLARLKDESDPAIQGECLRALGARLVFAAKSAVLPFLASPAAEVRIQAARALRTIGTPSDIPAVLEAYLKAGDEVEKAESAGTAAALAGKTAQADGRAAAVISRLAAAQGPGDKARLIELAGRIGDDSSLPAVRTALGDSDTGVVDAAARALAAWPTPSARYDALFLAGSAKDETHRLLALQGFIRMTAGEKFARPEDSAAAFKEAAGLASRPEEKKLILAALPGFACPASLALAEAWATDSAVQAEAKAAADKIKAKLAGK
jgi:HEAT repeat protein